MKRPLSTSTSLSHAVAVMTGIALSIAISASASLAQENSKWFVLRHDQTGDCWIALLIKIDGAYRHGFAQTAGGPYDTREEALEREKELEDRTVCKRAE